MAINNNGAFSELTFPKSAPAQKKKISKPIDKSTWDLKTKVSQKTIDEIKTMGMTKALGSVKGAVASSKDDSSAKVFAEGVRRLYGDQRFNAAVGKTAPAENSSVKLAPRNATMANKAEDSRKPFSKTIQKKLVPAKKSENKITNTGRKVAAAGALALTAVAIKKLGPVGAALAAKGAVQEIGKDVGKFIPKETVASKTLSAAGRLAAKAKRPVTQSQLEAMKAEATKKGIKLAPKSAIKPVIKKTVKKKVISNKKLAGSTGASTALLSGNSVRKK